MKRKQVMALLLSATLAFGTASPVMAAEVKENEKPAVETVVEENKDVEAEKPEEVKKDETVKAEDTAEAAKEEIVKEEQKTNEAVAVPEEKQEAVKEPTQQEQENPNLVTDGLIKSMSSSLTELVEQLEKDYTSMTDAERTAAQDAFDEYLNYIGMNSMDEVIREMKGAVTEAALKQIVAAEAPEKAESVLTAFEESIVEDIDYLRNMIRSAKRFAKEDKTEYMKEQIALVLKQLSSVAYTAPELFDDEYIAGINDYIGQIQNIRYDSNTSIEEYNRIIDLLNKAIEYLSTMNTHLSTFILEDSIKAADAYAAFLKFAPASLLDEIAFDGIDQENITYKDSAEYAAMVKEEALVGLELFGQISLDTLPNEQLLELSALMNQFKAYYYGNLVDAYKGISNAIVADVTEQAKKIAALGYTGEEKAAYEAALNAFNTVAAGKEYSQYAPAAEKLQNALDAYKKAAENYVVEEAEKKLAEAQKAVEALQKEVEENKEYYLDAYENKVAEVLAELKNADPKAMTAEEIASLVSEANTVVAERTKNYTKEVYNSIKDAEALVAEQNKWHTLMSEDVKNENLEAIAMTNELSAQIKGGVAEDVDAFMKAYEAVVEDLAKEDSLLMKARYAAADEIIENAEKYYKEETQKPHTKGLLEALRAEIDALKASVKEWDDAKVMENIQKVTEAKQKVLLDKVETPEPPKKPETEKPTDQKKPATDKKEEAKKNDKKAVNTGDETDAAAPGVLSILSLAGIAAILGKKRR